MPIATRLTERLGITHPVILAPMGAVSGGRLAAAGSNAGAITKSKLSVLAYLHDFTWYNLYSRPMTGEVYRCTPRGPVADDFFRAIDELYEAQAITLDPAGSTLIVRPIELPRPKLLSNDELALATEICSKWRQESTEAIISFALQQPPCKAVKTGDPIPYEAILGEPKSSLY